MERVWAINTRSNKRRELPINLINDKAWMKKFGWEREDGIDTNGELPKAQTPPKKAAPKKKAKP